MSHAECDEKRPSDEFRQFIERLRDRPTPVKVGFTSQPRDEHVSDYTDVIEKVVGAPAAVGDIRLQFDNGHWTTIKHSIQMMP